MECQKCMLVSTRKRIEKVKDKIKIEIYTVI